MVLQTSVTLTKMIITPKTERLLYYSIMYSERDNIIFLAFPEEFGSLLFACVLVVHAVACLLSYQILFYITCM
jgi:hypothetical protein